MSIIKETLNEMTFGLETKNEKKSVTIQIWRRQFQILKTYKIDFFLNLTRF